MLIYKFYLYVNTNVTFSHVGIDGDFVKVETPEMGILVVSYLSVKENWLGWEDSNLRM